MAHGADAVCFFQWRQSAGGAEKYHSPMLPHAGQDSAIFKAVTELDTALGVLSPVTGSRRAPTRTAIQFDWESWWASELDSHPTSRLRYRQEVLDWYSAFLAAGVRVGEPGTSHAAVSRCHRLGWRIGAGSYRVRPVGLVTVTEASAFSWIVHRSRWMKCRWCRPQSKTRLESVDGPAS